MAEHDVVKHNVETSAVEKQADPKIVDTLSIDNLKTIGEASAGAAALAAQNAVANQQRQADNATAASARMNDMANSAVGSMLKRMAELDPVEAGSIKKVDEAGLARSLAELQTAIVAMGQSIAALVAK